MKNTKETTMTMKMLADEWLSIRCCCLARSTVTGYLPYINNHILPSLGNFTVREVKQKDIQKLINSAAAKGLSTKSQKNLRGILHSMFEYAVVNDYTFTNPVTQLRLRKTAPFEYKIYTREQFELLLTRLQGDKDIIPVMLAGICGLRLSEVMGLRWSDVDLEKGVLSVHRAAVDVHGKVDIKSTPKTASSYCRVYVIHAYEKRRCSVCPNDILKLDFLTDGKSCCLRHLISKIHRTGTTFSHFYSRCTSCNKLVFFCSDV